MTQETRNAAAAVKHAALANHVAVALSSVLLVVALLLVGCASSESSVQEGSDEQVAPVAEGADTQAASVRIGSLKGPTSVGLASMMMQGEGEFTVAATADELVPQLLQGDLDIILVPANLAATLYQKTDGDIRVLDINTLGVLYAVSAAPVDNVSGFAGRTVYMTGKGTVPEYTVRALLEAAGLTDEVTLEFRSEPAEIVALLAQEPEAIGILPQPYATSAVMKVEGLKQCVDLTQAWDQLTGGADGTFITGVTVATASFVDENPELVAQFLQEHAASVEVAQNDPSSIAEEVVNLGIIDNLAIAEAAIPYCNVVCITGSEMENDLTAFLNLLYEQDPASVGGALPAQDFYA